MRKCGIFTFVNNKLYTNTVRDLRSKGTSRNRETYQFRKLWLLKFKIHNNASVFKDFQFQVAFMTLLSCFSIPPLSWVLFPFAVSVAQTRELSSRLTGSSMRTWKSWKGIAFVSAKIASAPMHTTVGFRTRTIWFCYMQRLSMTLVVWSNGMKQASWTRALFVEIQVRLGENRVLFCVDS